MARQGVVVAERTLQRYALKVLSVGRSARDTTLRVADCEPGSELQVDFGKTGLVPDPASGRKKVCWSLLSPPASQRLEFPRFDGQVG